MKLSIKKKFDSIDQSKISDQAKQALSKIKQATDDFKDKKASKAIQGKFNELFAKIKSNKPEAIRGAKKATSGKKASASSVTDAAKSAIKKVRSVRKIAETKRKSQGISTAADDIERDAGRPALKSGRRVAKKSKEVYYEYRENRIDRRPAKYPKLEDGGMMASGGIYASDDRYKISVLVDDTIMDEKYVRARNQREANEMAEDLEPSFKKLYGDILRIKVEKMMASGGDVGDIETYIQKKYYVDFRDFSVSRKDNGKLVVYPNNIEQWEENYPSGLIDKIEEDINNKYSKGGGVDDTRYPRKADDTGKGIFEGWVVGDGEAYYETEEGALKASKDMGYETIQEAYENDDIYFTDWYDEDLEEQGYYYTADGKEIELDARGGFVSKGEKVWKKMSHTERLNFLEEKFSKEITPASKHELASRAYNFLPKNVKIAMESKYANVEEGEYAKGGGVGQIIKSTIPPASLTDKQKRLANEIANEVVKTGLDAIIQYDSGTIDIIVNYGVKHTPSLSNGRFRVFWSSTGDNKIQYLGVGLGHYDGYEIKRGWSKDLDINQIQDVVKKDRDYYNSYKYAKGGGISSKTKYLSVRDIKSIETKSGTSIKSKDIIDGAYIKKSVKYMDGGQTMPEVSGFKLYFQEWDSVYDQFKGTIRTYPSNYWVATITKDDDIVFDSWESMVNIIDKSQVKTLWETGNIRPMSKEPMVARTMFEEDVFSYKDGGQAKPKFPFMNEIRTAIKNNKAMDLYNDWEDDNYHTENVVLLAEAVGDKEDIKEALRIWNEHVKMGSMSTEEMINRTSLNAKLWPAFVDKYKDDYAKGGMFKTSQYNTGRSWHLDRQKHNKSENWEIPMNDRKKS